MKNLVSLLGLTFICWFCKCWKLLLLYFLPIWFHCCFSLNCKVCEGILCWEYENNQHSDYKKCFSGFWQKRIFLWNYEYLKRVYNPTFNVSSLNNSFNARVNSHFVPKSLDLIWNTRNICTHLYTDQRKHLLFSDTYIWYDRKIQV